jgi:hypothetical protein
MAKKLTIRNTARNQYRFRCALRNTPRTALFTDLGQLLSDKKLKAASIKNLEMECPKKQSLLVRRTDS